MKKTVKDDTSTLLSIGLLVSVVASLAHEALGHGVGCLMDDGRITLITFLVFRCAGAGIIADGGGPVGVLIVGCAALALVRLGRPKVTLWRVFLLNLGATALFWACGQAIEEAFDGSDDWGHVASDLGWSNDWHWILAIVGLLGYVLTMKVVSRLGRSLAGGRAKRLLLPYLIAAASAITLGALWHGGRTASALDGLLSFAIAPVGYLFVAKRTAEYIPVPGVISRNLGFVSCAAMIWLAFALTVARGLGALS